jgi:hypothetical protein
MRGLVLHGVWACIIFALFAVPRVEWVASSNDHKAPLNARLTTSQWSWIAALGDEFIARRAVDQELVMDFDDGTHKARVEEHAEEETLLSQRCALAADAVVAHVCGKEEASSSYGFGLADAKALDLLANLDRISQVRGYLLSWFFALGAHNFITEEGGLLFAGGALVARTSSLSAFRGRGFWGFRVCICLFAIRCVCKL